MSIPASAPTHRTVEPGQPIADLSYRNYDGPLESPAGRWWSIARMSIRLTLAKKGFWWWSVASGYWYLILLVVFYIADTVNPVGVGQRNPFLEQIKWKDQFVHGYSFSQLFFFILALLTATGAIANDNRANALLVYLSKPCSRLDYVIGKWLGVFIPLTAVAFVPMGLFWLYGALSFREYGFVSSDPLMLFKLLFVAMSGAALHASLALGVSSLFNQARVAGATYAGLYFLTNFFTKVMQFGHGFYRRENEIVPAYIDRLFYASVDGMNIAMAKLILGTSGSPLLPGSDGRGGGLMGARRAPTAPPQGGMTIPSPPLEIFLPVFLLLCAGGVYLAWSRVKAVEVV